MVGVDRWLFLAVRVWCGDVAVADAVAALCRGWVPLRFGVGVNALS